MGKQKRQRTKFHIESVKVDSKKNEAKDTNISEFEKYEGLGWKTTPSDNIFHGININLEALRKPSTEDDRFSVRSLSKSIKSSTSRHLKKDEKKKLRHKLFIDKISTIYKDMKESKKKKLKISQTEIKHPDSEITQITTEELLNKIPVKVKKERPESKKQRGVKKSKMRQFELLKNVNIFRQIISNEEFINNPLGVVRSNVEKRLNSS